MRQVIRSTIFKDSNKDKKHVFKVWPLKNSFIQVYLLNVSTTEK